LLHGVLGSEREREKPWLLSDTAFVTAGGADRTFFGSEGYEAVACFLIVWHRKEIVYDI
jgi:hypothetical protein